ncbi:MAG: D-tyrosyl-tRNA(Tyr) deacylase [Clostridia bacterium]|nr:D-tyrosyl-tRNA(Tyr) deacylase [Clostridia bacterium]
MRAIVQRVNHAGVSVDGQTIGSCGTGFLVLLGVGQIDTEKEADVLLKKILQLRVFEDGNGKMNLSLLDIGGEMLVISQFTLFANCRHGNRPDFLEAAPPAVAEPLYRYFAQQASAQLSHVGTGRFGADMEVQLENHGPVTIWLDTDMWKKKSD